MALDAGLEPATQRLTAVCSTDWANQALTKIIIGYYFMFVNKIWTIFLKIVKINVVEVKYE